MNKAVGQTQAFAFGPWLDQCRELIAQWLRCDETHASAVMLGAGLGVYRAKFERGLTPRECVDDELSVFNE